MPKYITLIRFTEQGAKNIKQSTARARAFAGEGRRQSRSAVLDGGQL